MDGPECFIEQNPQMTSDPIRLFIGSSSNGEDASIEAVYEYTLRNNCSHDLEIIWMRQTHDASEHWYGFETERWSTPFSGFRWAIPEYCNFEGRAIYTDCDMINFRDIGELWDTDLENKPIAARKGQRFGGHEFCVMVIDNLLLGNEVSPVSRQRQIPEYHSRMINTFSGNNKMVKDIDPRWNCLDGEGRELDDIWQLHWTNMASQPWRPSWFTGTPVNHPRQDLVELFEGLKIEAAANGFPEKIPVNMFGEYDIIGK